MMVAILSTPSAPAPLASITLRRLWWAGALGIATLTRFAMPAERLHTSVTSAIREPIAPWAQGDTSHICTILVATSDPMLADLLQSCLTNAGFAVLPAQDGQQACDLARQQHPDLLVLDRQLPVVDCLEVCRTLRAELPAPIIIIAAHTLVDDLVVALDRGADDYLTRPFSPGELIARIRTILRRRSHQAHDQGAALGCGAHL